MSDQKKGIFEKVFKVQASVERIKKDNKNPHFKNTYAHINDVLEAVLPSLNENKVLLTQPTFTKDGVNYLKTSLIDYEDGSEIVSDMVLPLNLDAQKTGSALTYYRRYQLISILGLQAVDDDGKAASNPIKDKSLKATDEQVKEILALTVHDDNYRKGWLNYLSVSDFSKASSDELAKAIIEIKKQTGAKQ